MSVFIELTFGCLGYNPTESGHLSFFFCCDGMGFKRAFRTGHMRNIVVVFVLVEEP